MKTKQYITMDILCNSSIYYRHTNYLTRVPASRVTAIAEKFVDKVLKNLAKDNRADLLGFYNSDKFRYIINSNNSLTAMYFGDELIIKLIFMDTPNVLHNILGYYFTNDYLVYDQLLNNWINQDISARASTHTNIISMDYACRFFATTLEREKPQCDFMPVLSNINDVALESFNPYMEILFELDKETMEKEKGEKNMIIFKSSDQMIVTNEFAIKKVLFNYPATIVFWKDGTKTVVKAQEDDPFIPEVGLAMAICKKALGTNKNGSNYYDVFKKWVPKEGEQSDESKK